MVVSAIAGATVRARLRQPAAIAAKRCVFKVFPDEFARERPSAGLFAVVEQPVGDASPRIRHKCGPSWRHDWSGEEDWLILSCVDCSSVASNPAASSGPLVNASTFATGADSNLRCRLYAPRAAPKAVSAEALTEPHAIA
ncbi:hypothetical protein GCM10009668_00120 [Nocardioides dubius]|uniref:Uncharacterized protein n=1 Tax=Nocardioides dubius TaxID=317019 RepID=A0ABP4E5S3_9ACTN